MDAINKAFEILDVFLKNEDSLSIRDIATLTKISSATTHRITSILVKRGYIEQAKKRGKYSLSTAKLVDLTQIIRKRLKVRTIALPYLQELSQVVNETVEMAVQNGPVALNIEVVRINHLLNVNIRPGSSAISLYSTGVGKIFLAYMSDQEFQNYIGSVILKPRTSNTITNLEKLKRHLSQIRRSGVAFDDEEHELGIRMVAAPVRDWEQNVIAAIGVIGTSIRISKQRMTKIAPAVKKCALQVSQALGYEQG